jgi:type VI protein secretion system component Hcp
VRRRRPEEERTPATTRAGASAPASPILALQQSAGNHAVTQMLARDKKEGGGKAAPAKDTGSSADFDGELTVPLISTSWGKAQNPNDPGQGSGSMKNLHEASCTSAEGESSVTLMQWSASGKHIDTVVIDMSGIAKATLHDVIVASFHSGGGRPDEPGVDSWELSFGKADFEMNKPKDEKKP